jgi:hypothetical protein
MSDDTHSEARVTIWASEALKEQIADRVDFRYGSISAWVREACQTRMTLEDALAAHGHELPEDPETREELVETVVRAGTTAAAGDIEALLSGDDSDDSDE